MDEHQWAYIHDDTLKFKNRVVKVSHPDQVPSNEDYTNITVTNSRNPILSDLKFSFRQTATLNTINRGTFLEMGYNGTGWN